MLLMEHLFTIIFRSGGVLKMVELVDFAAQYFRLNQKDMSSLFHGRPARRPGRPAGGGEAAGGPRAGGKSARIEASSKEA